MNTIKPRAKDSTKKILNSRDEGILKDYDEQTVKDIPSLALAYNVSPQTVRNVLSKNGIKPVSNGKRGRKPLADFQPNTKVHSKISHVLSMLSGEYRLRTGQEPTYTAMALEIGISRRAFEEIMAGRRDIPLSELQAIAKKAKISLAELVTP